MAIHSGYAYNGPRILTATVTKDGDVKFSCGFSIPRLQVEYAIGKVLQPDDKLTLDFRHVKVERDDHKHLYKCQCGKEHR